MPINIMHAILVGVIALGVGLALLIIFKPIPVNPPDIRTRLQIEDIDYEVSTQQLTIRYTRTVDADDLLNHWLRLKYTIIGLGEQDVEIDLDGGTCTTGADTTTCNIDLNIRHTVFINALLFDENFAREDGSLCEFRTRLVDEIMMEAECSKGVAVYGFWVTLGVTDKEVLLDMIAEYAFNQFDESCSSASLANCQNKNQVWFNINEYCCRIDVSDLAEDISASELRTEIVNYFNSRGVPLGSNDIHLELGAYLGIVGDEITSLDDFVLINWNKRCTDPDPPCLFGQNEVEICNKKKGTEAFFGDPCNCGLDSESERRLEYCSGWTGAEDVFYSRFMKGLETQVEDFNYWGAGVTGEHDKDCCMLSVDAFGGLDVVGQRLIETRIEGTLSLNGAWDPEKQYEIYIDDSGAVGRTQDDIKASDKRIYINTRNFGGNDDKVVICNEKTMSNCYCIDHLSACSRDIPVNVDVDWVDDWQGDPQADGVLITWENPDPNFYDFYDIYGVERVEVRPTFEEWLYGDPSLTDERWTRLGNSWLGRVDSGSQMSFLHTSGTSGYRYYYGVRGFTWENFGGDYSLPLDYIYGLRPGRNCFSDEEEYVCCTGNQYWQSIPGYEAQWVPIECTPQEQGGLRPYRAQISGEVCGEHLMRTGCDYHCLNAGFTSYEVKFEQNSRGSCCCS